MIGNTLSTAARFSGSIPFSFAVPIKLNIRGVAQPNVASMPDDLGSHNEMSGESCASSHSFMERRQGGPVYG
jgi:hypothetical protein